MQDQFTFNRLTFNVGLRAEQWKHFATTGENIFTFDWEFAPRLSAPTTSSATAGRRCTATTAATTIRSATT